MAISTYADLKTAIATWMHRGDLTDRIPEFIELTEEKNDTLLLSSMRTRATSATVASSRYLALPTGYLEMQRLRILTDPPYNLHYAGDDEMSIHKTAGCPVQFAVHEEIEFDRVSDDTYNVEMLYYKRFDRLTDDSDTNWLLTNHASIYLYGALAEAAPYIRDSESAQTWEGKYLQLRANLEEKEKRKRQSKGKPRASVSGTVV